MRSIKIVLLVVMLCFPFEVWAAIGTGGTPTSTTTTGGGIGSISTSHTASGSDRLAIVGVCWRQNNNQTISALTYDGVSILGNLIVSDQTQFRGMSLYYAVAPSTSSVTVAATFSSADVPAAGLMIASYTGVDQATPIGNTATTSTAGATTLQTSISSATTELALGAVVVQGTASGLTEQGGQTSRLNISSGAASDDVKCGLSDETGASTSTLGYDWTTSVRGVLVLGAIKEVSAAPVNFFKRRVQ